MNQNTRADNFGETIRTRRRALGLSISEVARRAAVDKSSLSVLERGLSRPKPDTIGALAAVLGLPASDLFAAADYLRRNELPSIRPYMRVKFNDLPEDAVAEVEQFIDQLRARHRLGGPEGNEDED